MSVRLDEKLKRDLSAWAAANHNSVNEIITRLVRTEIGHARANLETDLHEMIL
jgi:predicted HicB family RNase H-like nuclease